MQAEPRVGHRQALGVLYGLDPKNLDCLLDELLHFDMTRLDFKLSLFFLPALRGRSDSSWLCLFGHNWVHFAPLEVPFRFVGGLWLWKRIIW